MKTTKVHISEVKENPDNPRVIKNEKFKKLVQSIKDFPEMLNIRPIVVDKDMFVLGGNMRLRACKEVGIQELNIIKATSLTKEQQKEFMIKDNSSFGEWDWDTLGNVWDTNKLQDWGMDVWSPNLDDFNPEINPETYYKEMTDEEYEKKKLEIDNRNYEKTREFIECICPKCFHEFNIDKQ